MNLYDSYLGIDSMGGFTLRGVETTKNSYFHQQYRLHLKLAFFLRLPSELVDIVPTRVKVCSFGGTPQLLSNFDLR